MTSALMAQPPEKHAISPRRGAVETSIVDKLGDRSVVLVGLMGAGKSSVGRRLAARLALPFVDADSAIELAAGMSIPEIFERHGEADFRAGERRVIARLLNDGPQILATGGGAYMNEQTRHSIAERGISLWLEADLDVLMRRVRKRGDRPLLRTADPEATMRKLMDERYPVYALADIRVRSLEVAHEVMVDAIVLSLSETLACPAPSPLAGS